MLIIKPRTSLILRFPDKICRKPVFEFIFIFYWIMQCCKRHRSGIKPGIQYFGHTAHLPGATRVASKRNIINNFFMQISYQNTACFF